MKDLLIALLVVWLLAIGFLGTLYIFIDCRVAHLGVRACLAWVL